MSNMVIHYKTTNTTMILCFDFKLSVGQVHFMCARKFLLKKDKSYNTTIRISSTTLLFFFTKVVHITCS